MPTERLEVSPGPRVVLVVNDETTRFWAENSLLFAGNEVVLEAGTLGEVFDWARQGSDKKAEVIVLGDHLPSGLKGREGIEIEKLIRVELPGVQIITLSFETTSIGDKRVSLEDFYQRKVDLGEIVNSIKV